MSAPVPPPSRPAKPRGQAIRWTAAEMKQMAEFTPMDVQACIDSWNLVAKHKGLLEARRINAESSPVD